MKILKKTGQMITIPKSKKDAVVHFLTDKTIIKNIRGRKYKLKFQNGDLKVARRFYDYWDLNTLRTQFIIMAIIKGTIVEKENENQFLYTVQLNWFAQFIMVTYCLILIIVSFWLLVNKSPGIIFTFPFYLFPIGIFDFIIENFDEDFRTDFPKLI